ncbi:MAG: hypothetical protein VKI63_01770 [Cyanobium sp.]|nr:hypothetical protein [Cyanobium sp.]
MALQRSMVLHGVPKIMFTTSESGGHSALVESVPTQPLQRLVYPEFWPATRGYAYLSANRSLFIHPGCSFDSNDFYNAFFLGLWSLSVPEVALQFTYRSAGSVLLEIWHEMPSGVRMRIHNSILPSTPSEQAQSVDLALPSNQLNISLGHLFFRVTALDASCTLSSCGWRSLRPLRRTPRLALVITHFRRESQVKAFLSTTLQPGLRRMLEQELIVVLIVDNSQTIDPAWVEVDGVHIFPNANYGGSGGFARGMLEATDLGCTHCLLLDDDASLGEEGILRIWNRHAMVEEDTAIASILLQAENPHLIIDAAARYDGTCKGNAGGTSILEFRALTWLWNSPPHADFGAWCGFSFPLAGLRYYPFPFFVRGDDVLMPMMNRMRIRTLNGVASLAPRFERKKGPLQAVLDTRCEMLIRSAMLHMGSLKAAAYYAKPYLNDLVSYRYGHCLGMHAGLGMYASSETSFVSDLDGARVREIARPLARFWSLAPDWHQHVDGRLTRGKRSDRPIRDTLAKMVFALTLNGHLLPGVRLLQRHVFLSDLEMRVSYKDALFARQIVYCDHLCLGHADDQSRICGFDQRMGMYCLLLLIGDLFRILIRGPVWSRRASSLVQRLATAEFWRGVYDFPVQGGDSAA